MTTTKTKDRAATIQQARARAEAEQSVAETAGRLAEATALVSQTTARLERARAFRAHVLGAMAERGSLGLSSPDLETARQAIRQATEEAEDARALAEAAAAAAAGARDDLERAPDVDVAAVVAEVRGRALDSARKATEARTALREASRELLGVLAEARPLTGLPGMLSATRMGGEWLNRWLSASPWGVRPTWGRDAHPVDRDGPLDDWLGRAWPAPVEPDNTSDEE